VALLAVAGTMVVPAPSAAHARVVKQWFVRAAASAHGNGSRRAPFQTLAAAEAASRPGQQIVILPSPLATPALNGGIALKRSQTLIGAGPSVLRSNLRSQPRIENTVASSHSGDAIDLASGDRVENLVIADTYRGGIYGLNVSNVTIAGNNVSATNSSCKTGFLVEPFELPTLAPGVGAPFVTGLPNGWGSIMLDENRGAAHVTVKSNYVHNGSCSDGIDVRASGTARVSASVTDNTVTRLMQGATKQSVLAIGMQTLGTSSLNARAVGNSETYIGNDISDGYGDADSEGLFANSAGRSHLSEYATDNTFNHGLGHFSANCFEVVSSSGGPTMHVDFTHSTCYDVVGDVLEANNLSNNATMTFDIDHVVAEKSTFFGAPVWGEVEPGDDGDCLLDVTSGAADSTTVSIDHSRFEDCVADGLGVLANVVDGSGAIKLVSFKIENSQITNNSLSNLRVANVTPVEHLQGLIADSNLSHSYGAPLIFEGLDPGGTHTELDFGGGALGSPGGNCFYGGQPLTGELIGYAASAKHDWWGQAGGPTAGQLLSVGDGLSSRDPLSRAPRGVC
jgi:hypothetical protein